MIRGLLLSEDGVEAHPAEAPDDRKQIVVQVVPVVVQANGVGKADEQLQRQMLTGTWSPAQILFELVQESRQLPLVRVVGGVPAVQHRPASQPHSSAAWTVEES